MNSFKTELFRVSFDANDITNIVHIEHLTSEEYSSFMSLPHLVSHAIELHGSGALSKKEAEKLISRSARHLL